MSNAAKNIIARVVKNRLATGEKLKDVMKLYPKLTAEEIKEIKAIL